MTFQYCFDGSIKKVNNLSVSSPRTWGCFSLDSLHFHFGAVFPTHVGVFLFSCHAQLPKNCLPHARGGVSMVSPAVMLCSSSSPRTWGCFFMNSKFMGMVYVFPTHVGVFPKEERDQWRERRLPHARGGVSDGGKKILTHAESSPRTWGCFLPRQSIPRPFEVFPTHVGVFLVEIESEDTPQGLPHARGGVSRSGRACPVLALSSPRTWGGAKQRLPPESPFLTVGAFHVYP